MEGSQADPAFSSTAIETGKCSCRSQTKALPQQTREEFDSDDSRPGWRNLQVFYVAVDLFDLVIVGGLILGNAVRESTCRLPTNQGEPVPLRFTQAVLG
jgi:hypothetical protein